MPVQALNATRSQRPCVCRQASTIPTDNIQSLDIRAEVLGSSRLLRPIRSSMPIKYGTLAMRAFSAVAVTLATLLTTSHAIAQTVRATSAQAHWQSGVVQLAIKADLPDQCTRLVRAKANGVTARTLAVEVTVVRDPAAQCGATAGRVERSYSYNFPGITQAANSIALRFLLDGRELGRETTPIAPTALLPR